jgi:DNA polymerase III delta prime subunit
MKKIIDWSERKDGNEDTTGCGIPMLANYISILALAANVNWRKELKEGKLKLVDYQKVTVEIMKWLDNKASDEDVVTAQEMAKIYWKAAKDADAEDFEFNDTVLESAGKRTFRASPLLRSAIVSLGIADFDRAEYHRADDHQITYPHKLEVNWNKSWSNFRGINFSELLNLLKKNLNAYELNVLVGAKSHVLCKTEFTYYKIPLSETSVPTGKQAGVDDLGPNWGSGDHILFYGPPGTGKTREANKRILATLADQLETYSQGEITKSKLNGRWDNTLRTVVMKELRKFVTVCQFHSTYSYEDFIEGLRPFPGEHSDVRYEVVDGSFLALWKKATGKSANLKAKVIKENDEFFLEVDPYFIKLYDFDVESSLDIFFPIVEEFAKARCVSSTYNRLKIDKATAPFVENLPVEKLIPVAIKGDSWSPSNQYYVLIDEINRGKVSKIFGELLFALSSTEGDKYPEVRTQYSKTPLVLVKNLNLYGTMNSCDKSVDVLDQALKRRFQSFELMPLTTADLAHDQNWKNMVEEFFSISGVSLSKFLDNLNHSILASKYVDYDRQIGHSFLFKMSTLGRNSAIGKSKSVSEDAYCRAIFKVYFSDIFPVLQDFFIDRRDLLEKFVPKGFLTKNSYSLDADLRRLLTKEILEFDENLWDKFKPLFIKFIDSLQVSNIDQKGAA